MTQPIDTSRIADIFEQKVAEAYSALSVAPGVEMMVAVSGGSDSVALLVASMAIGLKCTALHCNFQLRDRESDRDEAFVVDLCKRLGVPLLQTRFNVGAYMDAHPGESLEMACRSLRYRWFGEVSQGCPIALGHHRDDSVETFMMNLHRSAGLRGLSGIPPRRGMFVRPLLSLTRKEILGYLEAKGIGYVTDSSNLSCDYRRNLWRNRLLPGLEDHLPGFSTAVAASAENVRRDLRLLDALVAEKRRLAVSEDGKEINLGQLFSWPESSFGGLESVQDGTAPEVELLWHVLEPHGVTYDMAEGIIRSWRKGESGKQFGDYLLDRGRLLYYPEHQAASQVQAQQEQYEIPLGPSDLPSHAGPLEIEVITREEFRPTRDARQAWFDLDTLLKALEDGECGGAGAENSEAEAADQMALTLRHWHHGDRIRPFGMKGTKLVSDILSDSKIPVNEKIAVWILTMEGENALEGGNSMDPGRILWIPGLKHSANFPVTESTRHILHFSLRCSKDC